MLCQQFCARLSGRACGAGTKCLCQASPVILSYRRKSFTNRRAASHSSFFFDFSFIEFECSSDLRTELHLSDLNFLSSRM